MEHSKEYRLSVGIMLINQKNEIFLGNRLSSKYTNYSMPQGGIITKYETPYAAMCRELYEEVGIKVSKHCYMIAKAKKWYCYNFPPNFKYMLKYKGQMQQWFLVRFTGIDLDIKLNLTQPQEFYSYIWTTNIIKHVQPVKQRLYADIYQEFAQYI